MILIKNLTLSNTFAKIDVQSEKIWKYQRYKMLINVYIDKSILPPPFILISYIAKLLVLIITFFDWETYKMIFEKPKRHESIS